MVDDNFDALLSDLAAAATMPALKSAMADYVRAIGFDSFAYVAISIPSAKLAQPFSSFSYPDAWIEHYREEKFAEIDPTFPLSHHELLPFTWSGIIADGRTSKRQKDIYHEAKAFGLRQGLTIPIHGAGQERGLFSVTAELPDGEFERRFFAFRAQLLFGAFCYHNTMRERLGASQEPTKLGAREMEVLAWAGKGKTSWETGEILKVSENTVNFHLKSAMKKLGVNNKRQAVVRAIMLGLVLP